MRSFFAGTCFLCILFMQCTTPPEQPVEQFNGKNIRFTSLAPNTLPLTPLAHSGSGFFRIFNNRIYFFDDIFLTVSVFDTSGNYLDRYLGKGNRPDEIHDFLFSTFLPDSTLLFLGKSYNISRYTSQFMNTGNTHKINWHRNIAAQYGKYDAGETGTYSFNYYNGLYDTRWLPVNASGKMLIPLWISPAINTELNGFVNYKDYYQKGRAIGVVDINSGELEEVFGTKSAVYLEHGQVPNYDFLTMDTRGDSVFVSQSIDPVIQVYAPDNTLAYMFGVPGTGMRTDYPEAKNPMQSEQIWIKAFTDYGYYYSIYCDPDRDLVFRSYTKNEGATGGLQIYQHRVLIADIPVPKRFNIIGQTGGYYFADGLVNEQANTLGIYRFRLP